MVFLESNIFSSIIWHYLMILQTLANLAENEEMSICLFKKPLFLNGVPRPEIRVSVTRK